ncbi:DUF3237 domain-containing protein [Leifsonia aquatica]|uniref:DUF3237 domain-containing protein n=1 Tax=Leifsonia aquatica TaxID=144185 RepID=UPI0038078F29
MSRPLPVPTLQAAFEVRVELGAAEDHGLTGAGRRRVVPIVGGTVDGSTVDGSTVDGGFTGRILPGGADWQLIRPDGTIEIDARCSARSADGELLYVRAAGVRAGDDAVLQALGRGEDVDPASYYFRTFLSFESAARPELTKRLFVASCAREAQSIRYTAYRID